MKRVNSWERASSVADTAAWEEIAFREMEPGELPLLSLWLSRPHVSAWWARSGDLEDVRRRYLPRMAPDAPTRCFIAQLSGAPLGFIQAYRPSEVEGESWPGRTDPFLRGIDFLLAEEGRLGQGWGTAMIRAFCVHLFRDPSVHRIQADPSPENEAAIAACRRVGFRAMGEVTTRDGPAVILTLRRVELRYPAGLRHCLPRAG